MKHQQLSSQDDNKVEDDEDPKLQEVKEYTQAQLKALTIQGCACLFGGISLHLILGSFYLWGGISLYATSYFKIFDSNVSIYKLAIVFPIQNLMTNFILSFGVKLAQRFGFKTIIFVGGMLHSITCILCSQLTNANIFIIIYGLFGGIATGLVYMLPISLIIQFIKVCGWKYFPSNRGHVSAVILTAYGLGAFGLTLLGHTMINQENINPLQEPDKNIVQSFPKFLQILGICYFFLTLISVCLVRYPKQIHLEQQKSFRQMNQAQERATIFNQSTQCQTLGQGIKSKSFFYLLIMIILSTQVSLLMANGYKIYGLQKTGLNDANLSYSGAIAFFISSLLRGLWTRVMNRYGFKKIYSLAVLTNCITIPLLTQLQGFWPYLILLTIIISCGGGMQACFPFTTTKVFGYKIGPAVYGLLFIGVALSNLIAYLLMVSFKDLIGFEGVLWICFGSNIGAFILGLIFKEQVNWKT